IKGLKNPEAVRTVNTLPNLELITILTNTFTMMKQLILPAEVAMGGSGNPKPENLPKIGWYVYMLAFAAVI
ncbi:hypothetical protein TELCIR_15994, partial [Teladorsagia circumcincta]